MLQSFLVYSLLVSIMILFGRWAALKESLSNGKNISFFRFETIFPLICFSAIFGMRYGVGTDHLSYLHAYQTGEGIDRYEIIFRWITNYFANNKIHFSIYFGVLAFLQVFFFFFALKNERFLFPYLSFFLFAGGYELSWMNLVRYCIASCIIIYSIQFISNKKIFKYYFWCCIAFFIHKTSVVSFFLYPLLKSGRDYFKSISLQLIIIFIAICFHYSGFQLLNYLETLIKLFSSYLLYDDYTMDLISTSIVRINSGFGFVLLIIIDVIIILYSSRIKKYYSSKFFIILYNLFYFGVITRILFSGFIILGRPFQFLDYFKPIILSYLLYYLFKNSKSFIDQMAYYMLIVMYLALFVTIIYYGKLIDGEFVFFWQT